MVIRQRDERSARSPLCRDLEKYLRDNPGIRPYEAADELDEGRWDQLTMRTHLDILVEDGRAEERDGRYYPSTE